MVLAMPLTSETDSLVTIEEAADILRVSVRTVARMQQDGALEPVYLPPVHRAKVRRFRRSDVDAIAARAAYGEPGPARLRRRPQSRRTA